MAASIRQLAEFSLGTGNGVFGIFHQMALSLDTLPGSTLVVWGGCSAAQTFAPQAAQNSALGSPAPTGDATNGIYTQAENVTDPTGDSVMAAFTKQNAAIVTAGTLFTVNYSGSCDFNSMMVMEVTGVSPVSLIGHSGLVTSVGSSGTDTINSGTAVLGSSPVMLVASCYGSNLGSLANVGSASASAGTAWDFTTSPILRVETQHVSNPGTMASYFSPTQGDIFIVVMLGLLETTSALPPSLMGQTWL